MPSTTAACLGCQNTIFIETNSPVRANGVIVGHVHKVPDTVNPRTITAHCIRLAFWRLQEQNPGTAAIVVEGRTYDTRNTPHPANRRLSGSGASAVRYSEQQKPVATHTFTPPSRHH